MYSSAAVSEQSLFELARRLQEVSAKADRLSGVRDILEEFTRHFQSSGALLWEIAEEIPLDDPKSRLFVQAQYFEDCNQPPFYHLGMESITARCLRMNQPEVHRKIDGVWDSDIPVSHPSQLEKLGLSSFVSVPVRLNPDSILLADAAITLYRRDYVFSDEEFDEISRALKLFSSLYRSIQDRVSLSVLTQVQTILREARFPTDAAEKSGARAREAMHEIVSTVATHFQFVEAVVYLHNRVTDLPNVFSLIGAIWPWSAKIPQSYEPGDGGTGWVLRTGGPLRIFDMANYAQDREYYARRYVGMEWPDRVGIVNEARRHFSLSEGELFPLSYLCVPIIHKQTVTGALRCCISRNGPYHVDQDIIKIISSVAEMVADWWDHWTHEEGRIAQLAPTASAMGLLGFANRNAMVQLRAPAPDVKRILADFLEVCRKSVPQADIVQLWLQADPDGPLVLREPRTSSLETVGLSERSGERNAFIYSFKNRCVLHEKTAATSPYPPPSGKHKLASFTVAPVRISQQPQGVLYFAATRPVPWPDTISNTAAFLAEQLALYLTFHFQMMSLREVQTKLAASVQEQGELLLDFQHQLRTPINIAKNSADRMQECSTGTAEWVKGFGALISSTRRARTVASNLQLFVALAQSKPIPTDIQTLATGTILDGIEQASSFLYNKAALRRDLQFNIQKDLQSISRPPVPPFRGDPALIELVIDNLLDNAVKYSYDRTVIRVEAGAASYGKEVYISFRNKGLPIDAQEAIKLIERGHRGSDAKLTSPEGTGIGLWMVAEVMRSLRGRLEIRPTDAEGWNDIRLYFEGVSPEKSVKI